MNSSVLRIYSLGIILCTYLLLSGKYDRIKKVMLVNFSYENLDKCVHYIAYESGLDKLLSLISENTLDDNAETMIAAFILESILVEKLSSFQNYELQYEYGLIGSLKKDDHSNVELCKRKRELEETFPVGISKFLKIFDGEFENCSFLLKRLRKLFKNYKFRTINVVNDYSIFFFTFKLFDLFCNEAFDQSSIEEMADAMATACFERLHNPYKKRAVTVTCESLLRYVKQFDVEDYRYTYAHCFIEYIKALNNSVDLPDYIRYSIFDRFGKHIVVMNTYIRFAPHSQKIRIELEEAASDRLKVNKYISNKIQKLKKNNDIAFYAGILKNLQKSISKLIKYDLNSDSASNKQVYKCVSNIYNGLISLSGLAKDGYNEELYDIIKQYSNLDVNVGDESINLIVFLAQILEAEDIGIFRTELGKFKKDNIYIKMLFTQIMHNCHDMDSYGIAEKYSEVMTNIHNYISANISVESVKEYERIIEFVELDAFNFSILTIDENDSHYKIAMRYITQMLD